MYKIELKNNGSFINIVIIRAGGSEFPKEEYEVFPPTWYERKFYGWDWEKKLDYYLNIAQVKLDQLNEECKDLKDSYNEISDILKGRNKDGSRRT